MPHPQALPALLLGAALAAAAVPPALAADSRVGVPRYDPERGAVVVPYAGSAPAFRSEPQCAAPRLHIDLAATPTYTGRLAAPVIHHPHLVAWATAPYPQGQRVRLTLVFLRPVSVRVTQDAQRRELLLIPQDPAAVAPGFDCPSPGPGAEAPRARVLHTPQPLLAAPAVAPAAQADPTRLHYRGAQGETLNVTVGEGHAGSLQVIRSPEREVLLMQFQLTPASPEARP